MTSLLLVLARSAGTARAALVAACTALVTALLLVAVAVLRLPSTPHEVLADVVADPGTRGGSVLAVVLLALPPLLLLQQAVRLGTAARERRLAGLRLAGATVGDVRRVGAAEVGVPALAGGLLGLLLYAVLRSVLGGVDPTAVVGPRSAVDLVPTTVAPTWWQAGLVVLGVGVLGAVVGARASADLVVTPVGVTRRAPSRPPRPWPGVLLLAASPLSAGVLVAVLGDHGPVRSQLVGGVAVALAVLGMVTLASWAAYRAGVVAERRARTAAGVLAARRLVVDPRPAGRAAAAVGGIALVSGGAAVVLADVTETGDADRFYLQSLALVAAALLVALLVVVASLAVHSAETLLDSRRSVAALAAQGASSEDLSRSLLLELLLTVLPVALLGVVLSSATLGGTLAWGTDRSTVSLLAVPVNLLLTPALVVLAAVLATLLTRPLVRRAAAPENLRTE